MASCVAKDVAGNYYSVLEDACDAYLCRLWPEWKTNERTYMFPPAFSFRYAAPTGEASGAVRLSKSEEIDLKGDVAELQIFRSLDEFGRKTKQPMVVITQFKFKEFIEEVLLQYFPKEEVDALFANLSETDLSREIDFLVMHRRVGFILIEVKATEKFKSNRYLDAKKQLEVGERFINALLSAKGLDIPIYKVIAMPHVVDEGRDGSGLIDLRKIHLNGMEGEEDGVGHFEMWWANHFIEKSFEDDEAEFVKMISIFVGERAAICATAKILSGVFKSIDEQRFLERSYDKMMKRKGSRSSDAVVKTTDVQGLSILTKQFLFLNVEQLALWNGAKKQLFCGAPGSGKTILLQHKALECAKKGEKVVILVPPPLDKLYKEFFSRNQIDNNIFLIITFDNLASKLSLVPYSLVEPFHIFVDEFQTLLVTSKILLDPFTQFLVENQSQDYYQWITYDVNQMILTTDEMFGIKRDWSFSIPNYLSELCRERNFHHASSLTTVMRSTSEVYEFLQRYLRFSFGKKAGDGPQIPQQYWHHPVHLGHQICGPQVIVEGKISYASYEERFVDCCKMIKDEIHEWAKEDDVFFYQKVAILVVAPRYLDTLHSFMLREGIPVGRIGETENKVVLDLADYARSYEWPVVIAVCGHVKDMQNYIPISRAVTRLVMLWWK